MSKEDLGALERGGKRVGKVVNHADRGITRFIEMPANIAAHGRARGVGLIRMLCWLFVVFPPLWIGWLLLLGWASALPEPEPPKQTQATSWFAHADVQEPPKKRRWRRGGGKK